MPNSGNPSRVLDIGLVKIVFFCLFFSFLNKKSWILGGESPSKMVGLDLNKPYEMARAIFLWSAAILKVSDEPNRFSNFT